MPLKDLCELVERLRRKSQTFGSLLSRSEALTRYVLIDPILRSLGWDTEDPELVRPEYSPGQGSADYAILKNNEPLAFIEAKPFGQSLQQGIMQSINYCLQSGTPYFVITDGLKWEIYQTHAPVPLPQKRIAAFDLAIGDVKEVVMHMLTLWQPGSLHPSPIAGQSTQTPSTTSPSNDSLLKVGSASQTIGNITLSSFLVKAGDHPPLKIVDPNGTEHTIKAWKDILVSVTEWLVQQGSLTTEDCPVTLPTGSRHLVGTFPKHPSGRSFFQPVQVDDIWLESHASATQIIHESRYLLTKFGKGADFRVIA